MKTIYMKPELTVIKINKPCLLNASLPEAEVSQRYDATEFIYTHCGDLSFRTGRRSFFVGHSS